MAETGHINKKLLNEASRKSLFAHLCCLSWLHWFYVYLIQKGMIMNLFESILQYSISAHIGMQLEEWGQSCRTYNIHAYHTYPVHNFQRNYSIWEKFQFKNFKIRRWRAKWEKPLGITSLEIAKEYPPFQILKSCRDLDCLPVQDLCLT